MKDIFKKTVDWYIKGNDYRKAALELYDEETLIKEVESVIPAIPIFNLIIRSQFKIAFRIIDEVAITNGVLESLNAQ